MNPPPIVYATVDGVLQPLGYSQVFRLIEGLVDRGWPYVLVSAERASDLDDKPRVARLEGKLQRLGVPWHRIRYASGSARDAAANLFRFTHAVVSACRSARSWLVHARSYHGGAAALTARGLTRVPYLFDARSYWVDERVDGGRWFRDPRVLRSARSVERQLYRRSLGFVGLTELQAEDVRSGKFGRYRGPAIAIPTCADYADFASADGSIALPSPLDRSTGPLVGLVGSTNPSYKTERSLVLARKILEQRTDARLLILTGQQTEFAALVEAEGIDSTRTAIRKVPHEQMPAWLREVDWGIMLLNSTPAKRASVPTKLAEFFAAGVRPIHHGCNDEVTDWVRRAGSGIVLDRVDDGALAEAAKTVAESDDSASAEALLAEARERTRAHFDLQSGIDRYDQLLHQLQRSR
ncbi:MAG: glycosyltransferase [Myxococcota bacterium]